MLINNKKIVFWAIFMASLILMMPAVNIVNAEVVLERNIDSELSIDDIFYEHIEKYKKVIHNYYNINNEIKELNYYLKNSEEDISIQEHWSIKDILYRLIITIILALFFIVGLVIIIIFGPYILMGLIIIGIIGTLILIINWIIFGFEE